MEAATLMDLFFADDSRQNKPSRPGMGPLVAIGGIHVPDQSVRNLERIIDTLCADFGFPPGEMFKWSPGKELWMRDNLISDRRRDFFNSVLAICGSCNVTATVIIEDTEHERAIDSALSPEADVTRMFLERVEYLLKRKNAFGLVIVDRPSGPRASEEKFLTECLETVQSGTEYVKPERIAINVLSTPSRLVRLLQVADLVTACTTAFVGGEDSYSPGVFPGIKRLIDQQGNRIGGVGMKIHPDGKYANLYHWLFEDKVFYKGYGSAKLPMADHPYSGGPGKP